MMNNSVTSSSEFGVCWVFDGQRSANREAGIGRNASSWTSNIFDLTCNDMQFPERPEYEAAVMRKWGM